MSSLVGAFLLLLAAFALALHGSSVRRHDPESGNGFHCLAVGLVVIAFVFGLNAFVSLSLTTV